MGQTIVLLIEYEGTSYHGFQYQLNAVTIQGVIEEALNRITGEGNRIKGAGRTDTGVHARGQVASFTSGTAHSPETFLHALNHYLPEDVAIRQACRVREGFDPRRHAVSRRYRYCITNRPARPALERRRALWVRDPLDADAMDNGARALIGHHDLASFSGPLSSPGVNTNRTVYHAKVDRHGCEIAFEIVANAFLPQQVRRTAGALVTIGKGKAPPESIADLIANPKLGAADRVAPAHGLYLMEVTYPQGVLWNSKPDTRNSKPETRNSWSERS